MTQSALWNEVLVWFVAYGKETNQYALNITREVSSLYSNKINKFGVFNYAIVLPAERKLIKVKF
jgi:hypothetical protein